VSKRRGWRAPDPVPERGAVAPRRPGDPTALAPLLDQVLDGLGAPPADALATLFARWSDLAGDHLAEHGMPASMSGGVLVVVAADPLWATEWRYRQGEVLRRCDEVLGAGVVERLEVRVRRG
jgi:predicted nucleic acid-binding Zn ribbon protein